MTDADSSVLGQEGVGSLTVALEQVMGGPKVGAKTGQLKHPATSIGGVEGSGKVKQGHSVVVW